jgi:hypothetical protein
MSELRLNVSCYGTLHNQNHLSLSLSHSLQAWRPSLHRVAMIVSCWKLSCLEHYNISSPWCRNIIIRQLRSQPGDKDKTGGGGRLIIPNLNLMEIQQV